MEIISAAIPRAAPSSPQLRDQLIEQLTQRLTQYPGVEHISIRDADSGVSVAVFTTATGHERSAIEAALREELNSAQSSHGN